MLVRSVVVALSACALAGPASAAEGGRIGVAFRASSGQTLGVVWHVSQRLALEPTVAFANPDDGSSDKRSGGLGLRYYVARARVLSSYAGARLSYQHTSLDSLDRKSDSVSGAVLGGLSCSLARHVSLFYELGWDMTRSSRRRPRVRAVETSGSTFTSSIGAVLYFN